MNPSGNTGKRLGNLLIYLAFAGALTWIAYANFRIVLWRISPAAYDSRHCVIWIDRHNTRYLTPGQDSFRSHFETAGFIGAAAFPVLAITGALILRRYETNQ